MKRFVEGIDRGQSTLFPERLEDWIGEDNPVRVIDVFVDELDLGGLGFGRVEPRATGRPGYHPSVLLKLYIYGLSLLKTPSAAATLVIPSGAEYRLRHAHDPLSPLRHPERHIPQAGGASTGIVASASTAGGALSKQSRPASRWCGQKLSSHQLAPLCYGD